MDIYKNCKLTSKINGLVWFGKITEFADHDAYKFIPKNDEIMYISKYDMVSSFILEFL